jgi:hypothetical protein
MKTYINATVEFYVSRDNFKRLRVQVVLYGLFDAKSETVGQCFEVLSAAQMSRCCLGAMFGGSESLGERRSCARSATEVGRFRGQRLIAPTR